MATGSTETRTPPINASTTPDGTAVTGTRDPNGARDCISDNAQDSTDYEAVEGGRSTKRGGRIARSIRSAYSAGILILFL